MPRFPSARNIIECRREMAFNEEAIYVAVDPRDNTVRYVGRSTQPKQREKQYRKAYNHRFSPHNLAVRAWIQKLCSFGLSPKLIVVDVVKRDRASDSERFWVRKMGAMGDLYNILLRRPGSHRDARRQGLDRV